MAGRRLKILVDPPGLEAALTESLGPLSVAPRVDDEYGFLLEVGEDGRLSRILDRGGFLLGSVRSHHSLIAATTSIVRSIAEPKESSVGLAVRAVSNGDHLTVTTTERMPKLAKAQRLIGQRGGELLPTLRTWLNEDGQELNSGLRVRRVVIPGHPFAATPARAEGVALLAGAMITPKSRQERLDLALEMTERIELRRVFDDRPSTVAAAFTS